MRLFLALSVFILAACQHKDYVKEKVSAGEISPLSRYEKDSLYIVNSIKVFVEGVEEENLDKLVSIYHHDYMYTYPTRQRNRYELEEEYKKAFSNENFFVNYPRFEITEISVFEESAYVVVNWSFTISNRKNDSIIRNRFYRDIQVWQRQGDGGWLLKRAWQYPIP